MSKNNIKYEARHEGHSIDKVNFGSKQEAVFTVAPFQRKSTGMGYFMSA